MFVNNKIKKCIWMKIHYGTIQVYLSTSFSYSISTWGLPLDLTTFLAFLAATSYKLNIESIR